MSLPHHITRSNPLLGIWTCQGCGFEGSFVAGRDHQGPVGPDPLRWLRFQLLPVVPASDIVGPWSYDHLTARAALLLDAIGAEKSGRRLLLPAGARPVKHGYGPVETSDKIKDNGIALLIEHDKKHLRLSYMMPGQNDPYVVNLAYPVSRRDGGPLQLDPLMIAVWRERGHCPACGCPPPPGPRSGHWFGDNKGVSGCMLHGRGCEFVYDQGKSAWLDQPAWHAKRKR